MRTLLLVMALAAPAAADPAPDQPCDVTIARASDDVRAQIAGALIGDRCHTPLEVRAIAVDGGIYVFARDPSGRVRERIVPDARGAGVLVAAWAAEAGAVNWAPELEHFSPTVVPNKGPAPALAPPSGTLVDSAATAEPPKQKQLAIFGLAGDVSAGVRITMDFGAHGPWTFGASAAASHHRLMSYAAPWYMSPDLDLVDTRSVGTVAYTWGTGSWRVRGSLGFGMVYTRATTFTVDHYTQFSGGSVFPFGELAFTLDRDLAYGWGASVGVLENAFVQTIHFMNDDGSETVFDRHGLEWQLMGGVYHRL